MSETSKKILWIDDEIEFLRSHVAFLGTRGYTVMTANSGDEGIKMIRGARSAFDIVLLDKQMPVKSGAATLEEIKALWPALPVIIITGYQHAVDAALEDMYDGYLTKPVDPNKLLVECKRLIGAKTRVSRRLTDRYLRSYSENKTRLGSTLSASGWMGLCTDLARWDLEIDGVVGDDTRQIHTGLKSDCGAKFCDFVIENYAEWIRGRPGRPLMAVDVLEKIVVPEMHLGRSVLIMVLSGARLAQFLAIEPELRRNFSVTATRFMAVLPTTSKFCLPALVSGQYPDAVFGLAPESFGRESEGCGAAAMKRLMRGELERAGLKDVKLFYAGSRRSDDAVSDMVNRAQVYGVQTIDMMNRFASPPPVGKTFKKPVPGNATLRGSVEAWFPGSPVLRQMKEVVSGYCTVILTSDHGHMYCKRGSEVYEARVIGGNLRCMFGDRVSVDEREVFLLEELSHFKLPAFGQGVKCLLAREDYYFTPSGGKKRNANTVQCGGISPEEMILPLYICRPHSLPAARQP
jgi:CheY-like chemotaxis protein